MYYRHAVLPEAVYLHDADALDWLGVIGVTRVLATVEHSDPPLGKTDPYSEPDLKHALKTIEKNLKQVPKGVQSPAARARVPALVKQARAYLALLKSQSEQGSAL